MGVVVGIDSQRERERERERGGWVNSDKGVWV